MSEGITFRNPTEEDKELMLAVRNASRGELPEHRTENMKEVSLDLFTPDYDPKGCWMAIDKGEAVGYAVALVESRLTRMGRLEARFDFETVPAYRGRGIEQEFANRALEYSRSRGMKSLMTRSEDLEKWKNDFLPTAGFRDVHHWYRMVRLGNGPEPARRALPPGFEFDGKVLTEFSDDELGEIVSVSNAAFSEVFNFYPMTLDDMKNFRAHSRDVDRISWVEKDGGIVGICVGEECVPFNKEHGTRMGYIMVLCVLKQFRGQGLGAFLLEEGLNWILGRGMDHVYLAVDAENPQAIGLYTSAGFSILRQGAYYRTML